MYLFLDLFMYVHVCLNNNWEVFLARYSPTKVEWLKLGLAEKTRALKDSATIALKDVKMYIIIEFCFCLLRGFTLPCQTRQGISIPDAWSLLATSAYISWLTLTKRNWLVTLYSERKKLEKLPFDQQQLPKIVF